MGLLHSPELIDPAGAPVPQSVLAFPPTLTASPIPPTATLTPTPTVTPFPSVTPTLDPAQPTAQPRSGVRIGLQAGHWKTGELPDELSRLRTSTGTSAGGVREVDLNLAVAQRVAEMLRTRGIEVDVLPATVPPSYLADAFVAIHADGSSSTKPSGYKASAPWRASPASQHLLDAMIAEYGTATKLKQDGAITMNMRGYFAFNWMRHTHAVAKTTPAIILEMGFLTNASDRDFMVNRQDRVAVGIANGIIRYLNERNANDLAALQPPEFKTKRPASPDGALVRASPSDTAKVIYEASANTRLFPFQERDGWLQVVVRGAGNVVGWVRGDQLVDSTDPAPTPPPASDT